MTQLTINIAPEKESMVKKLVEALGGEIIKVESAGKTKETKEAIKQPSKRNSPPSPTYLFGKWKNLDMDAKQLRVAAWERNSRFL